MRTAPQREQFDQPKVRRGFVSRSQNVHRATARAISLADCTTGPTKTAPVQTQSRACQAGHLKATTPGSQIRMARQREHAAFQNTAPAQRNDTSSLRSYDSHTGPTKTALADPSKTRFHDEFQWHTLIASPRTVADGCELWSNSSRTRPPLPDPH